MSLTDSKSGIYPEIQPSFTAIKTERLRELLEIEKKYKELINQQIKP